ncbi:septum formation initiator family protein [Nonomuraea sp. MCN248]|uniref:Septum formation initiator family protein n=1 Tax=Nonomuraea corallina TaxID=2989783 RepID=A0ABT4SBN8_9ACTN|nr:septum formation initiator family protein [Nonomuraea corallina]MDA0634473.1 septum formation initiator family protein [Nonomuraea corallina]
MAKRPQLTGRAAILAVVVCAIAMSLAYPVRTYIAQRRDIAELREERSRVEAERQRLLAESRQVSDPNWVKRTAKERLHYCGEGERCFVVMDQDPGEGQAAAARPAQQPPWYQTLWESVQAADSGTGRRATERPADETPDEPPGQVTEEDSGQDPGKDSRKDSEQDREQDREQVTEQRESVGQ